MDGVSQPLPKIMPWLSKLRYRTSVLQWAFSVSKVQLSAFHAAESRADFMCLLVTLLLMAQNRSTSIFSCADIP